MAEGLGAAAAGLQLGVAAFKTVNYLVDLKSKIEDGPEHIRGQTEQVDQLIALTSLFEQNMTIQPQTKSSLDACLAKSRHIKEVLDGLTFEERDRKRVKLRRGVAMGLREKELHNLFDELEAEKTALILRIQKIDQ